MTKTEYRYYSPGLSEIIIGSLLVEPELFESDSAQKLNEHDFPDPLHRLVYFTLYNLFIEGHKDINGPAIDHYLSSRPKMFKLFQERDGYDFVNSSVEKAAPPSFKSHVEEFKKFSLLRGLERVGVDTSHILDWDSEDPSLRQAQMEHIASHTAIELADEISERIDREIEKVAADDGTLDKAQGGEGLMELIESYKEAPEMGLPMYGDLMNTAVRGARLGKFYLRSSPTGGGKSRAMMADAVNFGVDKIFNPETWKWEDNGVAEPSLFITTELDIQECQTLEISFVTGFNEDQFLDPHFSDKEWQVVEEGVRLLEESPIWIEHIPNFSIQEIERIIRRNVRENGVKYVGFDYMHTSMKFLQEIASISSGMKLREDQILFMLSSRLKDLAGELNIFIQSATQLNGNWQEAEEINQNLLRGSDERALKVLIPIVVGGYALVA